MLHLIVQPYYKDNGKIDHVMIWGHNGNKEELFAVAMLGTKRQAVKIANEICKSIRSDTYAAGERCKIEIAGK